MEQVLKIVCPVTVATQGYFKAWIVDSVLDWTVDCSTDDHYQSIISLPRHNKRLLLLVESLSQCYYAGYSEH